MRRPGTLIGVVVAHLVAVSACYQPETRDCIVSCAGPMDCTGGQVCTADGWCAMPDNGDCRGGGSDGEGLLADAATATADALDLCTQGCSNGTCVAGVCVIDCSAPSACRQDDIQCPANLPCRVVCGEEACAKKVLCEKASSCEVQCSGDGACGDEVVCNTNRCSVSCTGIGSCQKKTKCKESCACDVACIGALSCPEASECPGSTCRIGNGCTSQIAGCNNCSGS